MASQQEYKIGSGMQDDGATMGIDGVVATLLKWWKLILISTLVFGIFGFLFAKLSYTPTYTATGTMIVSSKRVTSDTYNATNGDIVVSQQLANTFTIVLKSNALMEDVAKDLQLELSPAYLKSCITIKPIDSSEVMQVSVTTPSYDLSVNIVNSVMKLSPKIIAEKVHMGTVKALDEAQGATLNGAGKSAIVYTLVGLLAGLVLASALVLLLEFLRDTIKSIDEVHNKLHLKVYGDIPLYEKRKRGKEVLPAPLLNAPGATFPFVEAYKALRTRVEILAQRTNGKTILITSTAEQEGKSTTCINLAISLAQKGRKVIVVDADLRKPTIAEKLGKDDKEKNGLSEVLLGKAQIEECIREDNEHGIHVLFSGKPSENPSELLDSEAMKKVVETLDKLYDYIIIDSPPAAFMIDSVILSELVDVTLLVVKNDLVSAKAIRNVIAEFNNAGHPVAGIILNYRMRTGTGYGYSRYGYSRYGYSKSYKS